MGASQLCCRDAIYRVSTPFACLHPTPYTPPQNVEQHDRVSTNMRCTRLYSPQIGGAREAFLGGIDGINFYWLGGQEGKLNLLIIYIMELAVE